MKVKIIETLENWKILKLALIEKGYELWQMQYSYDMKEGFHSWFWKKNKSDVEVVTHNKAVQDDIISSKFN